MNIDLDFDEDVLLKAFFEITEDMTKAKIAELRKESESGEFMHHCSHDLRWVRDMLVEAAEKSASIDM